MVQPPGNDQCPGSFYATKFCETKCIHNYLYYITSSGVHDESSLLIQPKIPKDMLVEFKMPIFLVISILLMLLSMTSNTHFHSRCKCSKQLLYGFCIFCVFWLPYNILTDWSTMSNWYISYSLYSNQSRYCRVTKTHKICRIHKVAACYTYICYENVCLMSLIATSAILKLQGI